MYNQSNAITCLKYKTTFILKKFYFIYLKNLNLFKMGAALLVQVWIQFWEKSDYVVKLEWWF
jgi:hypothetical protein